jgi:hypothetical protein
MKLKVPKKNYSVVELYDTVAKAMGYQDVSKLNYDCREINCATNIHDGFFNYYREASPHVSEMDLKMSVSMILLNYGPKMDAALEDYEVEVTNKFIR